MELENTCQYTLVCLFCFRYFKQRNFYNLATNSILVALAINFISICNHQRVIFSCNIACSVEGSLVKQQMLKAYPSKLCNLIKMKHHQGQTQSWTGGDCLFNVNGFLTPLFTIRNIAVWGMASRPLDPPLSIISKSLFIL